MQTIKEKLKTAFTSLKPTLELTNPMQTPRLVKVVVSVGVGSFKDKKKLEVVVDRLTKITGQKPAPRAAKRAIASFKTRQGDIVGYQVTLRGARMRDFLDRLLNTALPRTKDFKGISLSSIDAMGNLSLGISEHTIFPETADEDIKDVFGLAVTIVTTATSRASAEAFFRHLGVPLRKT